MRLTKTQQRIEELMRLPASRTRHRAVELQRLVKRDLRTTARRNVRAKERGR